MKVRQAFILISILTISLIVAISLIWKPILYAFILVGPLVLLGISDIVQKKHAIKRNFPVLGQLRYILEKFRPEIMQYFVETDTQGTPINRIFRTLVYQRAKNVSDTTPFGTKLDLYKTGYEVMAHSMYPKAVKDIDNNPTTIIGNHQCKQPYKSSILNISAMSFGSLSKNAVLAMNKGAKMGGFAHNTGEGGLSPYHLEPGGDLIWQIGTGYFGCRNEDGGFDKELFKKNVAKPNVKMIEIKLSQGAKPGHGGILPAKKNTEEIAKIRSIKPFTDVHSPPSHSAFSGPEGLIEFVQTLRELSDGKPVGFKLCVGSKKEFEEVCQAMSKSNIFPDFITVDGGEGGTGAAPVEFSNSLGLPLREGLAIVDAILKKLGIRKHIKLIASGKIISSFHMARVFALGADVCNSGRAMMMAVGCIQALECNTDNCPVGVATQNKVLMKGLDVPSKADRVANYHKNTIDSFVELIAAAGLASHDDITREHIIHRKGPNDLVTYTELYKEPYITVSRD